MKSKRSLIHSVVMELGLGMALALSHSAGAWTIDQSIPAIGQGAFIPVGGLRSVRPLAPRFNEVAKPPRPAPRTGGNAGGAGRPPTNPPQPGGTGGGPRGPRWTPPGF